MSWPMALCLTRGQSVFFQNPLEKLPVFEKTTALLSLNDQAENGTVLVADTHPLGLPIDYFNTSFHAVQSQALPMHACRQDQQTILQSAEWVAFQAFCQQAEVDLTQSLQNLEHSWMKGYLLGEEKKSVQDHLRAGLQQVQAVCQIIKEITSYPTEVNWQRLKQAIEKLTEISTMAVPLSEFQITQTENITTGLAGTSRLWNEVQYFLAPVIMTGWGVLNKLGMLTEMLAKDIPIVGSLTSLIVTIYQRCAVRINQLKMEDQEQLIAVCHALTTAFEKMKGKQIMENIQNNTARTLNNTERALNNSAITLHNSERTLHNTGITAQHALNAAQEALNAASAASGAKQAVQNQSQIIATLVENQAALETKVADLKEAVADLKGTLNEFISLLRVPIPSLPTALIDKNA